MRLTICLLLASAMFSTEAMAAQLQHYWGFNGFPVGKINEGQQFADELRPNGLSDGTWTLTNIYVGEGSLAPSTIYRAPSNPTPAGYGPDFVRYAHVAATNNVDGEFLYAPGDILDFNERWDYSVVAWVRPETTNQRLSLFSIGDASKGFSFVYIPPGVGGNEGSGNGALQFYIYLQGESGYQYTYFDMIPLDFKFDSTSSNWHHVGFSIANTPAGPGEDVGSLTVNYYSDGRILGASTRDTALIDTDTLNGFRVGSSGLEGRNIGSCNYDDIKIFNGVLSASEAAESMKQGAGPLIPEPSSVLLSCLGLAGMMLRRRLR